jgi:hypothetical protein
LYRVEIQFGIPEKKGRLPRRLAAVPMYSPGIVIHDVAAVQLADSIIAEAGPLPNGQGTRFVVYQPQRKVQTLAVPCITIV